MLLIAALGLGLGLAACGESDEDKAKADVCDARDDIRTQVQELQDLTLGTATVDQVKSHLTAIGDDLKKIADAQDQLSESDRKQVDEANKEFRSKLTTLGGDIGQSVSLEDAAQQLKSDFADLATTYEQALGPIDCG
jgi:two-component sensor histidine kinase